MGGCICFVFFLAGCSTIPERDLENAFKYQRLKRSDVEVAEPIESGYHDYADKAWATMEAGGQAEYVSILELGDDALLARIHLIRAAHKSIDIQTFIWKDDPTTRFVFDELVKAAERGVWVRILIDALNKPGSPEQLARMARAHRNVEICLYKPLSEYAQQGRFGFWDNVLFKAKRMNRRMHNKLLIADGRELIAEERVGNELAVYDEYPAHPTAGEGPWHLLPKVFRASSSSGFSAPDWTASISASSIRESASCCPPKCSAGCRVGGAWWWTGTPGGRSSPSASRASGAADPAAGD